MLRNAGQVMAGATLRSSLLSFFSSPSRLNKCNILWDKFLDCFDRSSPSVKSGNQVLSVSPFVFLTNPPSSFHFFFFFPALRAPFFFLLPPKIDHLEELIVAPVWKERGVKTFGGLEVH